MHRSICQRKKKDFDSMVTLYVWSIWWECHDMVLQGGHAVRNDNLLEDVLPSIAWFEYRKCEQICE
jgi:hypothetical protein